MTGVVDDAWTTPEGKALSGCRFENAAALERWLEVHHETDELWVAFPKKGVTAASISRHEAVDVVLCFGWIDGMARSRECPDGWWVLRFTRRRNRSVWSKINRVRVEKLIRAGRMRPIGLAEVERARSDGRWAAAYDSPSRAVAPLELVQALAARPGATAAFQALSASRRYEIIVGLQRMVRTETRQRRAEAIGEDLSVAPSSPNRGD